MAVLDRTRLIGKTAKREPTVRDWFSFCNSVFREQTEYRCAAISLFYAKISLTAVLSLRIVYLFTKFKKIRKSLASTFALCYNVCVVLYHQEQDHERIPHRYRNIFW